MTNKLKQTFGLSEDQVPWSEGEKAYKEEALVRIIFLAPAWGQSKE